MNLRKDHYRSFHPHPLRTVVVLGSFVRSFERASPPRGVVVFGVGVAWALPSCWQPRACFQSIFSLEEKAVGSCPTLCVEEAFRVLSAHSS